MPEEKVLDTGETVYSREETGIVLKEIVDGDHGKQRVSRLALS